MCNTSLHYNMTPLRITTHSWNSKRNALIWCVTVSSTGEDSMPIIRLWWRNGSLSLTDAVARTLTSGHRSQGRQTPAGVCSCQDQETCRHQRAGRPLPTHPCCFRGCGLSGRPETWLQQLWRKQQSIDGANRAGGCIQTGPRTFSPHPRYERHSGTCQIHNKV